MRSIVVYEGRGGITLDGAGTAEMINALLHY